MKFILATTAALVCILAVACSPAAPVIPTPQSAPGLPANSAPLGPTNTPTRAQPSPTAVGSIAQASPTTLGAAPSRTVAPSPTATPSRTAAPSRTSSPSRTPSPTLAAVPAPGKIPAFSRIYVIVMENKEYDRIIEDADAPYIDNLAKKYGLATNYTGITHPSQPNYIALFSGSMQGVTDNSKYDLTGTNLADQLEAKGKTWKIFAENYPLNCFTGTSAKGGADGPGEYARKHNPAISFLNISTSPKRCSNITDFSHLDPAAADFIMILPNMCNMMHDCTVNEGDRYLSKFIPRIMASPAWSPSSVVFLTWDEGNTDVGGGGHIPTVVISDQVRGVKVGTALNHYSLLRTIQDAWGLGCLENSCSATNLAEFFK